MPVVPVVNVVDADDKRVDRRDELDEQCLFFKLVGIGVVWHGVAFEQCVDVMDALQRRARHVGQLVQLLLVEVSEGFAALLVRCDRNPE